MVAVVGFDLNERTPESGQGATHAGFSLRGGRATHTEMIEPSSATDLVNLPAYCLGDVNFNGGQPTGPGINRTLPMSHPVWPWLYASAVLDVRGVGKPTANNANTFGPPNACRQFPQQWPLYPHYEVDLEYTSRPYNVLPDGVVNNKGVLAADSWVDFSGATQALQTSREWLRWCEYEETPLQNIITVKRGVLQFADTDPSIDGKEFPDELRKLLPDSAIKFRWYSVPQRFLSSKVSYIRRLRGYVNQDDWFNWPAASLLFMNYNAVPCDPPTPTLSALAMTDGSPPVLAKERLVDIEMIFLHTERPCTTVGLGGVSNDNWVAKNHNVFPGPDLAYHYVTQGGAMSNRPVWLSIPFSVLFTDPDFRQPGTPP